MQSIPSFREKQKKIAENFSWKCPPPAGRFWRAKMGRGIFGPAKGQLQLPTDVCMYVCMYVCTYVCIFGGGAGYRGQNRTQREKSVSNMGVNRFPKKHNFFN